MKAGYEINDSLLYGMPRIPDYIVCDNREILHRISFFPWYNSFPESLISVNTVVIFKIKQKSITLSND